MNRIIIYILILRYVIVYLPLIFYSELGYEKNDIPYELYDIFEYVGQYLFIGIAVLGLAFFTKIKELKKFIYYRAACELFNTIKLLFIMLAIENTIIHDTVQWEWQLGIFMNLLVMIYFIYKWKKNKT